MEGFSVWIAYVDTCMATIVTCLMENATGGGHCKKLYANSYGRTLQLRMEQVTGNIQNFVKYLAKEESEYG